MKNINKFQNECPAPVTASVGFRNDTNERTRSGSVIMEEWRDIKGYEGVYQASDLGRIRSLDKIRRKWNHQGKRDVDYLYKGRVLKSNICNIYLYVCLMHKGVKKSRSVHRLIAKTFVDNPNNKPNVNHIDFNHYNNSSNNLEWCTQYENIQHTKKHGRSRYANGEDQGKTRLTKEDVIKIRCMSKEGVSQGKIASMYKMSRSGICNIISKKSWKYV